MVSRHKCKYKVYSFLLITFPGTPLCFSLHAVCLPQFGVMLWTLHLTRPTSHAILRPGSQLWEPVIPSWGWPFKADETEIHLCWRSQNTCSVVPRVNKRSGGWVVFEILFLLLKKRLRINPASYAEVSEYLRGLQVRGFHARVLCGKQRKLGLGKKCTLLNKNV